MTSFRISRLVCSAVVAATFVSLQTHGAGAAGAPGARPAHFAVSLPLRNGDELKALIAAQEDPASPMYQHWLTRAQFAARFGPGASAKTAIANELKAAGFEVRAGSQAVFATGSRAAAERYFHTQLRLTRPDAMSRPVFGTATPLQLSPLLARQSAHVVGLDGLPEFHSNAIFDPGNFVHRMNYFGKSGPYLATDLKQAYDFPSYKVATGAGVSIGIISSSPVKPSDVEEYFSYTGDLAPPKNTQPEVFEFPIDGGGEYDAGSGATGEVTLDVEMAAGAAPGAQIGIFNVPDLSSGNLLEAYSVAVESGADIVSSSIGGCEKAYDNQVGYWVLESLDNAFAEGTSEGVTFVGASGDNAAYECGKGTTSTELSVQTPTDDPYMIAVGGTTDLVTTYTKDEYDSSYVKETSYDSDFTGHGGSLWGSCGGYSVIFKKPAYQDNVVSGSARGVPDVAMHMGGPADTNSLDEIYVGGQWEGVSGTSAAAPEFAGLLALRVQIAKKPQGDIHASLYDAAKKSGAFHRDIAGTNGYKTSSAVWDPVLGLGTPYGRVIALDPKAAPAGIPFSSSNP